MPVASYDQAMAEFARNTGSWQSDRQWILTDYDVWVRNPHYSGPPQRHPEDDSDLPTYWHEREFHCFFCEATS